MNVDGQPHRTIRPIDDPSSGFVVEVIDQLRLPGAFAKIRWASLEDAAVGIETMVVRGAPLIGVAAAFGLALALKQDPDSMATARKRLLQTRPTAINLRWALDQLAAALDGIPREQRGRVAYAAACRLANDDVEICRGLGRHGHRLLAAAWAKLDGRKARLDILTHCNAGWLATVDIGTALAPIYAAFDAGLPIHVWVDETRPRNQGALLTAWELQAHGIPHTVIVDNAGGHFMQHGQVDVVVVGADRVTATGDVCNKVGTYLKALAAKDNDLPFYAVVPSSTIDWTLSDGVQQIPIEERRGDEVRFAPLCAGGTGQLVPECSPVANPAFDVTPARLVSAIITERGVAPPNELRTLFPEHLS